MAQEKIQDGVEVRNGLIDKGMRTCSPNARKTVSERLSQVMEGSSVARYVWLPFQSGSHSDLG